MQERGNIPRSGRKRNATKGHRPRTEDAATALSERQKCEKSHAIQAGFLPVPEPKTSRHSPGSDGRTVSGKAPSASPLPFPVSGEPEPQQRWAGIGPDGTGCPFPQATKKGGHPRMSSLRKNQAYRLQGKQAGGRMTGRRDLACQAHLGPDTRIAFDELHSTGDLAADPGLIGDLAL